VGGAIIWVFESTTRVFIIPIFLALLNQYG